MASNRRMDDAEFKRRLSEVAEWKLPDTPRETSLNQKKKRGRKSAEEKYQDEHEEVFMELFEGVNPTYAPMLLKVKCQPTDCVKCGQHCPNGRQEEKKLYEANKKKHWRTRCVTCGKTENPYTGKFDLTNGNASAVWNSFVRDTKGAYKSKGNIKKEQLTPLNNGTRIENEHEIITFYHGNKSQT